MMGIAGRILSRKKSRTKKKEIVDEGFYECGSSAAQVELEKCDDKTKGASSESTQERIFSS